MIQFSHMCAVQYSLSIDCTTFALKLCDGVMSGRVGHPVLSLKIGILLLIVQVQSGTGGSALTTKPGSVYGNQCNQWHTIRKALNTKLSPLLPKI
jgi:hypothetical protein